MIAILRDALESGKPGGLQITPLGYPRKDLSKKALKTGNHWEV
jgi:hypothetical protein